MSSIVRNVTRDIRGDHITSLYGQEDDVNHYQPPPIGTPPPSPEETELLRLQAETLRQQQAQLADALRQQNLLQPILFEQLGIEQIKDDKGNVTGYRKRPDTPDELQQKELERKLRQRSLDALAGNLPVDPGLERDLGTSEANLRETLRRQLGEGYETSTPGIEALANFRSEADALRYGVRHDTLTTGEALAGSREAGRAQRENLNFGSAFTLGQGSLPFVQAGTTLGDAFGRGANPYLQRAGYGLQGQIAAASNAQSNVNNQRQFLSSIFGSVAGMFG